MSARATTIAAAALSVLLAGVALAQSPSPIPEGRPRKGGYVFAGIPWLASADSVVAMLGERGYAETPNSRDKDAVHATGKIFDRYAIVVGMLNEHKRLIRWEITVPSTSQGDPYLTQRRLYDDAVVESEAKYGRRRVQQDRFRFPYERGDGRQSQALREGYATVRSEWGTLGRDHLVIALDRAVAVVLTYESPWWSQTENDRRRKKAKDL
jgi:hypothetical protein